MMVIGGKVWYNDVNKLLSRDNEAGYYQQRIKEIWR